MTGSRSRITAGLLVALLTIVTIPLAWDQEDPDGYVARWRVYRAGAAAGPYVLLKTVTTMGTRVEIPLGESRCFKVTAVDVLGQVSPQSGYWCHHSTIETGE